MGSKGRRYVTAAAGFLALGLVIVGCVPQGPVDSPSPSESGARQTQQPGGAVPSSGAIGGLDHVVIIVEENKPSGDIVGNAAAPYINKLAADFALANNYEAVSRPSLPNYIALTSGTTAGITDDCSPAKCLARVRSIADQVEQSGRSWKMYAEGMPAPCTAKDSGKYAVKHNPFMYYPGVTDDNGSCAAHVVPFPQLAGDLKSASTLPNYVFISPNMCNDMHDCPVETGDAWLSQQVPNILASPAFTTQNSLLVITWDEGSDRSHKVVTIFAGPAAKRGYKSEVHYSHYSLLHTIESTWGLAPLTGNEKAAPVMNELLK
ncbi:alkaline phosphatase family protein [Pseudarthrobacter sp. N5]|uniref:alkaline phosphatase family protein n=1 Tax=Pseudarthrobacter sp. N5 TaxID=3418416 RepID=UPI003CF35FD0